MATLKPGTETIRFRRPTNQPSGDRPSAPSIRKNRHAGLLQDSLQRSQKAHMCASFSLAFHIFLLVRVTGAMHPGLSDCNEVFNFWEPLHYLDCGHAFQTWETLPQYSIRSWAYILIHLFPAKVVTFMFDPENRPAFFAVRVVLALVSATCEEFFYRTVVNKINYHVVKSCTVPSASSAFLPSSFVMYFNHIGFTYFIEPTTSTNIRQALLATMAFATGAFIGWPFSIAVALPFVFEELFLYSKDNVAPMNQTSWRIQRLLRLLQCVFVAALLLVSKLCTFTEMMPDVVLRQFLVVAIDILFYGKLTIVPWNIVEHNVLSSNHGPNLYGTEPLSFYVNNLLLNTNIVLPFALLLLPALLITHRTERSLPYTLMAMRLLPMYVWFAIFGAQPHKEERFMYPVYPLIFFNAAVCLYLMRGWVELVYVAYTKSPYRALQTGIFSRLTLSVLAASVVISVTRGIVLYHYYRAPMALMNHFEVYKIPRVLNATGYVCLPPPQDPRHRRRIPESDEDEPQIEYDLITPFNLTLCFRKEWHRFPGSYLVSDGVTVEWIKSEFDGMLPGHFKRTPKKGGLVSRIHGTRVVPGGVKDMNKEEHSFYVNVNTCDYLVDSDYPLHPTSTPNELRYAVHEVWDRVKCELFLNARHLSLLTRTLWVPGEKWQQMNEFGDYCLLCNRRNMERKERVLTVHRTKQSGSLQNFTCGGHDRRAPSHFPTPSLALLLLPSLSPPNHHLLSLSPLLTNDDALQDQLYCPLDSLSAS
ncbi:glycosyltransferase family 22 protein [Cytidiella melzeri]|nr:glycosyltransferase family 22 protein [Cytidiella melzeri]